MNKIIAFFKIGAALAIAASCGCTGAPPAATDDAGLVDAGPVAMPDLLMPDMTPALPLFPPLDPHSGKVLSSVQLITITFNGPGVKYPAVNIVESFGDFVVKSNWYNTVGAEYGVGPGSHLMKVRLPINPGPGITDAQVVALLQQKIADKTLPPPPAGPQDQILYMVYFPSTTSVTEPNGASLCGVFAGYHSSASGMNGSGRIIYAVIGDCSGNPDDITVTASHELIEAATDPLPNFSGSYFADFALPDPWVALNGQEDGDLCEFETGSVTEGGFALQTSWSSAAATAHLNPCVPATAEPYTTVTVTPSEVPTIAAGKSATFVLTGWSTALVPPWAIVLGDASGSDFALTALQPVLSGGTISRGTTRTLTLKAPIDAISGSVGGVTIRSGPNHHLYPVAFTVQ